MNKTLINCRGTFFANGIIRIGALKFFDGETNAEAVVYYDKELTSPAPNPIPIDINGNIPQVFGDRFYKVYQYAIKPTGVNFPADYDLILDFYWDASSSANGVGSLSFVDTMSALKALAPANGDSIGLLGYYAKGDARFRVFTFDSASIDTPNDGNRVRPNGYGAGNWEEDSSSVIYASDFGLLNPSGNVNANMAQLVSWCNANGVTCVFDKGIYNLTAGSAGFSSKTIVEDGVYFNATGGEFTLALNSVFEVPQKSFGSDLFTLDVSASTYCLPSGLVPEIWGISSIALWHKATLKSGISGLRLQGSKSIPNSASGSVATLKRLVVAGGGTLTFNNTISSFYLEILSIEFEGRSEKGVVFYAIDNEFSDRLKFNFDARASWFSESLEKYYTTQSSGYAILIDQNEICNTNITVPYLRGFSGLLLSTGITTITKCEGSNFLTRTGIGRYSGVTDINHFADLHSEDGIKNFIESNASLADFQGKPTNANVTIANATVSNMRHSGAFTVTQILNAYNCIFTQSITASRSQLINCSCVGVSLSAFSGFVNHVFKNCLTNGTIAITSLITDKIDKLVFENCYNLGSSTPLNVSGLLANSRQVGSIISVRNNTPECFDDGAVPVGAWAQSYIDVQLTTDTQAAPASYTYSLVGKPFALMLPNIDLTSNTRLTTSSLSDLTLSAGKDVVTKIVLGALTIYTNGVLVSSAKVRVTGNLY